MKLRIWLCIFGIWLGLFWFVVVMGGRSPEMPDWLEVSLRWAESFLRISGQDISAEKALKSELYSPTINSREESASVSTAEKLLPAMLSHKPGSIKEISPPKIVCGRDPQVFSLPEEEKGLYVWTDSRGTTHITDKRPSAHVYEFYAMAKDKVYDYFNVTVLDGSLQDSQKIQLLEQIDTLFSLYGTLLPESALKKTQLSFRFFLNQQQFEQERVARGLGQGVAGFYTYPKHEAYVLFNEPEAGMKTALHEAVHAINRTHFKTMPKWLNEGLAEYAEVVESVQNGARISPNTHWYGKYGLKMAPVSLDQLFKASDKDWDSAKRERLYSTSWAFVYYLMDTPERREKLSGLLLEEINNQCQLMQKEQIEAVLAKGLPQLQTEFSHWLKRKIHSSHRI